MENWKEVAETLSGSEKDVFVKGMLALERLKSIDLANQEQRLIKEKKKRDLFKYCALFFASLICMYIGKESTDFAVRSLLSLFGLFLLLGSSAQILILAGHRKYRTKIKDLGSLEDPDKKYAEIIAMYDQLKDESANKPSHPTRKKRARLL